MIRTGNGISRKRGVLNTTDHRVARLLLAIPAAAFFCLTPPCLGDEARVIPLKHRTAEEIIPLIRPLLGPDDALTGMDYRLILRTSDRNLKEIERLLAQLDVAQQQLRITVDQSSSGRRSDTSHSVTGEVPVGDGGRIILPPGSPGKGGVTVQKDGLRYTARQRTTVESQGKLQTVLTLDGKPAYIRVGQSVPHVKRILALSGSGLVLAEEVELRDITTGFEVLPRVRGDRVRVEITPRLATLRDPATGLADFQSLTTTVEVKRGQWLDLGEIFGDRGEIEKAILQSASTEAGEHRTVRIKID